MIVHIMRGISGSGKSTKAKAIDETGENICSTDDYFMVNGVYKFDAKKLQLYHNLNFQKFLVMLSEKRPRIVVDNTNTTSKEVHNYWEAAKRAGYAVVIHTLSPRNMEGELDLEYVKKCADRNSHHVPYEVVLRQAQRFEERYEPREPEQIPVQDEEVPR